MSSNNEEETQEEKNNQITNDSDDDDDESIQVDETNSQYQDTSETTNTTFSLNKTNHHHQRHSSILDPQQSSSFNNTEDVEKLEELITRDAMEFYLFIRELMLAAGRLWSPVLTGLLLLVLYMTIDDLVLLYYFFKEETFPVLTVGRIAIYVGVRTIIMIIFPMVSIAFANSYLLKLNELFANGTPQDFSMIGKRDTWIDFLQQFPVVWTYYGIYITPERLMVVAWSGFLTLVGIFFTAVISCSL
jgi:hypothetical protein